MEQQSLQYSTKNIPVPSRKLYRESMITRAKDWVHRARWKAYFTLNPRRKPQHKNNYKFKSTEPAPTVTEMKIFEHRFANLVRNVKFTKNPNQFQETLKQDTQKILSDHRALIAADKSSNYYHMESKDYKELLEKEIHNEYKQANKNEIKKVADTKNPSCFSHPESKDYKE